MSKGSITQSKPVCKAKFIGAICRKRNPKFKVEQ